MLGESNVVMPIAPAMRTKERATMRMRWYSTCADATGFSLVELMITVAIIGVLAAFAVPNFLSYRDKSLVATAVSTAEGIRAALASYASDHHDHRH